MEKTAKKEILKSHVRTWQEQQKIIGFVPTMGALHMGHISLIREARRQSDIVVVSIFVNPLQFNNASDLEVYPRTIEADLELLKNESVDLVYSPEKENFYPTAPITTLDFGSISRGLEGAMRPGHFSGVGIVVSRLFHLVEPHKAFFGAKDLQQLAIIQTLVRDLAFEIEVVRCPTSRELSGLAMSSRNSRLSESGKKLAALLFQTLGLATEKAKNSNLAEGKLKALALLANEKDIEVEYLEWVDPKTMELIAEKKENQEIAICIAAWIEGVQLIDNLIL